MLGHYVIGAAGCANAAPGGRAGCGAAVAAAAAHRGAERGRRGHHRRGRHQADARGQQAVHGVSLGLGVRAPGPVVLLQPALRRVLRARAQRHLGADAAAAQRRRQRHSGGQRRGHARPDGAPAELPQRQRPGWPRQPRLPQRRAVARGLEAVRGLPIRPSQQQRHAPSQPGEHANCTRPFPPGCVLTPMALCCSARTPTRRASRERCSRRNRCASRAPAAGCG